MTMMTPKEEFKLSLVFGGMLIVFVGVLYLIAWMMFGVHPSQTTDGINAILNSFMRSPLSPYKGVL